MRLLGIVALSLLTILLPAARGQIVPQSRNAMHIDFPKPSGLYKRQGTGGGFPACGRQDKDTSGNWKNVLGSILKPVPGGFQTLGGVVTKQPPANMGKWEMNFVALSDGNGYVFKVETVDPNDDPESVTFNVNELTGEVPVCKALEITKKPVPLCPIHIHIHRPGPCAAYCSGAPIVVRGRIGAPRHPVTAILFNPSEPHKTWGSARPLGTRLPRNWELVFEFDPNERRPPPGNYVIRVRPVYAGGFDQVPITLL